MSAKFTVLVAVGLLAASLVVWKIVDGPDSASADGGETEALHGAQAAEPSKAPTLEVFAERASESGVAVTTEEESTAPTWLLEVFLEDGQPAAAARVAIVRDQSVLSLGATNESGCWETDRLPGPVDFVIDPHQAPLFRTTLSMTGDGGRVTLPVGFALAGQVLVEGRIPEEPVALVVYSDNEGEAVPGLPEDLWNLFFGRQPMRRQTDALGGFHFGGLDAAWSGRLVIPRQLIWEDEESRSLKSSLEIAAVRDDLLLRLKWRALLRGRVIGPNGEAVADAQVSCRLWGDLTVSTGAKAGSDGTFSIPVRGHGVYKLELDVRSADGTRRGQLALEANFDEGADLGDIMLRSARTYQVEVRATTGGPVQGARVFTGRNFEVAGEPTSSRGECRLDVPPGAAQLRVVAVGYESRDHDLPASAEDPVVVTLQPATRLEVRVTDADAVPVPGFLVTINAEEDLFRGPDDGMDSYNIADRPPGWDGSELKHGWSGDVGARLVFKSDHEGRVIVYGIAPGVPFDVEVAGPTGRRWAQHRITLEDAEHRVLGVELKATGRTLKGQVLNVSGIPLTHASVSILDPAAEKPSVLRSRSLPQGHFEVGPLFASTVAVFVRHRGYAPRFVPRLSVPASGLTREFRLEPGYRVRVTVVDEGGVPLAEVPVRFDVSDWPGASPFMASEEETDASGQATLTDLPAATLHLVVDVAGHRYERSHSTTLEEARIIVPVHGSLEVRWEFPMTILMSHELRLTPQSREGSPTLVDIGVDPGKSTWNFHVAHVLPGAYEVQLEVEDEDGIRHVLSEARTALVRERELAQVALPAR